MNIWFDYGHTEEEKNWKLRKSSTRRRWRSIRQVSVAAHECLVGVLSCSRAAKLNKQNPFKRERERERRTSLYIEIGFYFVSLILGFWLGDLVSFVGFEFPIINLSFLIPVSYTLPWKGSLMRCDALIVSQKQSWAAFPISFTLQSTWPFLSLLTNLVLQIRLISIQLICRVSNHFIEYHSTTHFSRLFAQFPRRRV